MSRPIMKRGSIRERLWHDAFATACEWTISKRRWTVAEICDKRIDFANKVVDLFDQEFLTKKPASTVVPSSPGTSNSEGQRISLVPLFKILRDRERLGRGCAPSGSRALKALLQMDIEFVDELESVTPVEWRSLKNFGRKSHAVLRHVAREYGVELQDYERS